MSTNKLSIGPVVLERALELEKSYKIASFSHSNQRVKGDFTVVRRFFEPQPGAILPFSSPTELGLGLGSELG